MQEDLDELEDHADEVKRQNLNSRIEELENEIKETKENLDILSDRADEVKSQNLNSKIHELTNEIAETKDNLNELSDQLENHSRFHAATPKAVLVLSTWNSNNKPMVVTFDGKYSFC